MKQIQLTSAALILGWVAASAQSPTDGNRALWGSICKNKNVTTSGTIYADQMNKVLVSWRMLPGDDENTAFDIYRSYIALPNNRKKLNASPITGTCYQDNTVLTSGVIYYLVPAGGDKNNDVMSTFTMQKEQLVDGLPYISIPLQSTEDVCDLPEIKYQANDCSVGDLDGDGQMEIVVKRLQTLWDVAQDTIISSGIGGGSSYKPCRHTIIWDAYKLDGTLLWRVKSGPNIILGNSSNFAIADFDGDGKAEVVTRTNEGTVFGDGVEIGDTNGDGITDYRTWTGGWVDHYTSQGPDYFSVIDGVTGRELARADFIDRGTVSEAWGDNYWKRANSMRLGAASFNGERPQIFLGRGVYDRTVVEGWDYSDGQLTRLWHFDSAASGGRDTNKDGKPNSAYKGQGNHSFNVADLDGDGRDEVMYGSCAFDDDGNGLWSTELGHGDANHVGKFLPDREGLQVYHCLESGKTMVALHNAKDGAVIWKKDASSNNDTGRCMVADIDPNSPGCEFWWAGSNGYSSDGKKDLGYKPTSCNMGIWFDGTLSRQLINENIIHSPANGRTFTIYRYDESFNNGSKSNPGWYGDMLGDWREEVILPDATKLKDLKVFTTWYPTTHKFPWLMTDHTYLMSCINENVGYNQPTNLGYYLGSDLKKDRDAWEAAGYQTSAISTVASSLHSEQQSDSYFYNLQGQRLSAPPVHGIYIRGGKKYINY